MKPDQLETFLNRYFWLLPLVLIVPIIVMHVGLRVIRQQVWFIMHPYWPLSIFHLKLPIIEDVLTLGVIVILGISAMRLLDVKKHFVILLFLIVSLVALSTNLLQGTTHGLVSPVFSDSEFAQDYWTDSKKVYDIGDYLEHYHVLQPTMSSRARSHPPGAVLWFWGLRQIVDEPVFVGFVIMLISLVSVLLVYMWAKEYVSDRTARFVALAFGLLPAVQIYSYASLNGVIMTSALGSLYLYSRIKNVTTFLMAFFIISVSFSLTHEMIWLIPVLFFISLAKQVEWKYLAYMLVALAGLFQLIFMTTGYSYIQSFLIGQSYEGFSGGWYGLVQPVSYVTTRLQNVLEILLFYGPYFALITGLSLWYFRTKQPLSVLAGAGIVSLVLFFLAGGYYTAETARGTFYLLPLLMLGAAPFIDQARLSKNTLHKLLAITLAQTVLMQMFGYYVW